MKDAYIEMRKAGHIDLGWFYNFYLQEFDKLSPTYTKQVKDMYGGALYVEVSPGVYLHKVEEVEREKIDFNSFATAFSMAATMFAPAIFEYCDKAMGVTKIEEGTKSTWKQVQQTEQKLFYIG